MASKSTGESKSAFLITGASSYLGKSLARILAKNVRNRLLLTSRRPARYGNAPENNNIHHLHGIDLSQEEGLRALARAADDYFPGKFHVVNCLGFFPGYLAMEELSLGDAKKVFESNVVALYGVAHFLLPLMCKRKGGHFIGFSSHTNYQHYPDIVAYCAAKAAVESMISGIANEYLSRGIIANTIALSTLLTETERKMKPQGDRKNWLRPEEVSRFIENFVLQPAALVNGNVIHLYKYSDSYFHQSYFERIKK
jgi:NAD(P)-dependent dehydrogenase (short-subunit alcohol dehydrogenase family)